MILKEHVPHHKELRRWFIQEDEMLMLGNQENPARFCFGQHYETLDPDGGDIRADLSDPDFFLKWPELRGKYPVVYNLGTIEHIWNLHQAYVNAAEMVKLGGFFANHAPVAGYEDHGIHVTDWRYLVKFFELNGYKVRESFFTTQAGQPCEAPRRGCGQNVIHWMVSEKVFQVAQYTAPQQRFEGGRKV